MTVYKKYSKAMLGALLVFSAISPSLVFAEASQLEKEFKDVKQEYSSYESIKSLTERGIIKGYADGSFKPFSPISRAHVAKLVAEMLEMDLDNVENPKFKDVPNTHPYYRHIAVLANAGIISGYQNGNFGPNDSLTRSQTAKIISEAFGFEQKALLSQAFIDVQNSDHFAKYLQTLIDKKITVGTTPTTFSPSNSVTRGQLATFLYRSDTSTNGSYISADFNEISGNQLITSKGSFEISSNLSGLFDEKNSEVLKNAHIAFRTNDNKITAIEVLELNTSGTTANMLVFDGGLNKIAGDVIINGDNIVLKSLVIEEDLIFGEEVKTAFAGKDLTIDGETVVQEASLIASISSFAVAAEKVSGTLDFNNVKMNMLHVAKKDFKLNFKNNSSVETMDILRNVIIEAKDDSKITNLNISGSVSEVVLNANIQNLLLSSEKALTISGSGNVKNARIDGIEKININTTGIIENLDVLVDILLELGSTTKIENIALPKGKEIKDIIKNYEDIKGNIDKVGGVKNPDVTPPVVTPPPSSGVGNGNSGGGDVQVPVASVSSISVANATTVEVVMAQINGVSFTWNGVTPDNAIHDGTKYQLTVPADSMKLNNTLVVSASGYSSSTKTFTVTESIDNLKVIDAVEELNSLIVGQEDGQTWLIKDGVYNHNRFDQVPVVGGQDGWYFPITVDNLTIVGESKEGTIITSDTQSPNGSWSSQDHISVWGDKVTIQNLTIKPKISTNKTIEVMGKDFTLSNVNFEQRSDQNEEFAGSLYFNPQNEDKDIGNVLVENVLINDAWISAGDAVLEGTLTLKNTTIDFRGSEYANAYGGYGVISKNEVIKVAEGSSFKVLADNSLVSLQRQILDRVPKGTTVELSSGTYYVSENLVVPTDVILDKVKNEAVVEIISEGTALVSNVAEFNAALIGDARLIRMAAGTYEFDSQIRIEKAISIIGIEGQTRITKGEKEWTNATGSKGYAPIITINSGANSVFLENLNISGADNITMTLPGSGTDYGSGINVVNSSDVNLNNITSNNNAAAGLIVNSSTVKADNFKTNGNGWYGVNVDNVSKSLDVPKSNFTLTNGTISDAIQIVSDKGGVTVNADSFKTYNVAGTTQSVWTNKELTYGVVIEGKNTIYSSI